MVHDTLLNNYGVFNFATNNPRGTKNATADFLLGLPSTMNQDSPTTKIDNEWYYALFFQDDFRVAPRLTLNLGVRYDLQMPITDPLNRLMTFVPGAQSQIVPTAPTGLLFPGDTGIGRGIISADKNNISPRVGMAWDPFGTARQRSAPRSASSTAACPATSGTRRRTTSRSPSGSNSTTRRRFPIRMAAARRRVAVPVQLYARGSAVLPARGGLRDRPRLLVAVQLPDELLGAAAGAARHQLTAAYVSTLTHRIPIAPDLNYPILNASATTANVDNRRPYLPGVLSASA